MEEIYLMLTDYLSEHFMHIPLESPLFYTAPIGLRFELGVPYRGVEDPSYFTNVLLRSSMIFREVFDTEEQLILVVKSYRSVEPYICFNQGEEVFPRYIIDKELLKRVIRIELEKHYEDNGDLSGISYQYILQCNMESIDYIGILKAIANKDFAIEPYVSDAVFFINPYKHIIFYMYDDRGMDLIAEKKEALLPIYNKYNSWILAYDKQRIDDIFIN